MEYWPDIIGEAAKSPLGILALMVLVVSGLAAIYFRNAHVGVRVSIFVLIFAGVVAFGFKIIQTLDEGPKQVKIPVIPGAVADDGVDRQAYNRIQDLYLKAKSSGDCRRIRNLISEINTFSDNLSLIPPAAGHSVKHPSRPEEPTIADLSRDRIIRIRNEKRRCFHQ